MADDTSVLTERRSVVPASQAAPLAWKAPNSVFQAGQLAAGDAPAADAAPDADTPAPPPAPEHPADPVLQVLQSCGEITAAMLARAVAGMNHYQADKALKTLLGAGVVEESRRQGRAQYYRLRASGFKAWLARQAGALPAAAPKRGRPVGSKTGAKAPARPAKAAKRAAPGLEIMPAPRAPKAAVQAIPKPTWQGAIGSDGFLTLSANGSTLQLDAQQARGITAWLARVDAVAQQVLRGSEA